MVVRKNIGNSTMVMMEEPAIFSNLLDQGNANLSLFPPFQLLDGRRNHNSISSFLLQIFDIILYLNLLYYSSFNQV